MSSCKFWFKTLRNVDFPAPIFPSIEKTNGLFYFKGEFSYVDYWDLKSCSIAKSDVLFILNY